MSILRTLLLLSLVQLGLASQVEHLRIVQSNGMELAAKTDMSHVRIVSTHSQSVQSLRFSPLFEWPGVKITALPVWDLHTADSLEFDVSNPMDREVALRVRLDDSVGASGSAHSFTGQVNLTPGHSVTVVVVIADPNMDMVGQFVGPEPTNPNVIILGQPKTGFDWQQVKTLTLFLDTQQTEANLLVSQIRLNSTDHSAQRYTAISDRYGQFASGGWPEKVLTDDDFVNKRNRADAGVRVHPDLATDIYGGLTAPTHFDATGFFRTSFAYKRWWLVTPTGRPFFSMGINSITKSQITNLKNREYMFTGLPDSSDPLVQFFGPRGGRDWYDMFGANLYRSLGPQWQVVWPMRTVARLKAWGFNTIGNWSDEELHHSQMPYVTSFELSNPFVGITMASGRKVPDPFDRDFLPNLESVVRERAAACLNDPWLIGYFSSNEIPWAGAGESHSLTAQVLLLNDDSAAKRELINELKLEYGTVTKLAIAWSMPLPAGWDELLAKPMSVSDNSTSAREADFDGFEKQFAERYYHLVYLTIRRFDPHHLFLGSRFASWTPSVVSACSHWCDVVSFNVYQKVPSNAVVASLWPTLGKPVLIGEFHFGSLDRGSFWGGEVNVGSELERAAGYHEYVTEAARNPVIVGTHWFQYADQPLTGRRRDGENGHIGLVSIADIPYSDFVSSVMSTNAAVSRYLIDSMTVSGH